MEKTELRYQAYLQILKEELIPAMGCTEPIAVAYAAAVARKTLGAVPERVCVGASGSMIKNVKSVIVPNTDNRKGLEAAAAAGIVAGRPEQKLEVIADVTPEETKAILAYLDQTDDHGRACGQWRDLRHHRDGLEGRALGPSADRSLPHQHRPHGKGRRSAAGPARSRRRGGKPDRPQSAGYGAHLGLRQHGGHRGREAHSGPPDQIQYGHCRGRFAGRLRREHRQRPAGHGGRQCPCPGQSLRRRRF